MESVGPYAACERNEKLRQIGTDGKGGHPCSTGCLQGCVPDKGHLNKGRAKERDTLTGQEKKDSFLPACALRFIHFTHPPVFGERVQSAALGSQILSAILFRQSRAAVTDPDALYLPCPDLDR